MKSLKFFAFVIVSLALTTTSCKKTDDNNDDDDPVKKTCYINKINYGDEYSLLTYNSNHQVIKIASYDSLGNYLDSYTEITYANGKISELKNYDSGTYDSKIVYHYASNGIADSAYQWSDEGNGLELQGTFFLTYTGDNLTKIESIKYFVGQAVVVGKIEYVYDAGNATSMSTYELNLSTLSLKLTSTATYEYDSKKSPYRGIGIDNLFIAEEIGFMSVNNPTKETVKDKDGNTMQDESYTYSYEYNDNDYPTKVTDVTFDNSETNVTVLTYDCE